MDVFIMLVMGPQNFFVSLSYSAIWWFFFQKDEFNKADFSSAHATKDSNFQFCLAQADRDYISWVIWLLLL